MGRRTRVQAKHLLARNAGCTRLQTGLVCWVHGDIGGGHPKKESGLSQYSLIWMLEEAKASGLDVFDRMADYVTGQNKWSSTTEYEYPKPDIMAVKHKSVKGGWWLLEFIPKMRKLREWPKKRSFLGFYLPLKEPRLIPATDTIDQSALDKKTNDPKYDPVNLR